MEHVSPHFRQSASTSKSMRVADCNPGTRYSRYETCRSQLNRFVLYNRCQDDRLFSQWTLKTRRNKLRSAIIAGIEKHSRKWKAIVGRSRLSQRGLRWDNHHYFITTLYQDRGSLYREIDLPSVKKLPDDTVNPWRVPVRYLLRRNSPTPKSSLLRELSEGIISTFALG